MTEAPFNHPGDEALLALSLGQLAEAELVHVSAHLGECPACCRRIDQLATDDRLLAQLQKGDANRKKELVTLVQRRPAVRALRRSDEPRADTPEPSRPTPHSPPSPVHPSPSSSPRQIGAYDILVEVGRGGMGVVYKARHRGLQRLAALKMVLAGEFASPTQELRFRLEAELAARVQHPNIVQVYEIGSYEGRPFLALEWVDGGSLADRLLDGKAWPPAEAAALIETLARAIDVAHAEGVVHRDLKPANILLVGNAPRGFRGGDDKATRIGPAAGNAARAVPRAGRTTHRLTRPSPPDAGAEGGVKEAQEPLPTALVPKITDFGLAQPVEGYKTLTQSGFLVGTPEYMAPEQAAGKRALVGPGTDIYALGVMLYELLTGQLPFQRDSTMELLRAVISDEPPRLRRLQRGLPRDLEAITLHCLEKEPRHRYPSALALAEDLQRFREGRQVVARPVGSVARLVRACRRRPVVTLLLALLAVSLFGGLGGVSWKWREASEQRQQANEERDRADVEKRQAQYQEQAARHQEKAAQYQAYRASLAAASAALENHDVDAARHLLEGESVPEALRGWEWRHLRSRLDDSSAVVSFQPGDTACLLAARDGLRVGVVYSAGWRITDLEGGARKTVPFASEHRTFGSQAALTRLGLRTTARVGNTGFDLLDDAGRVLCRIRSRTDILHPVAMSPDGTRLGVEVDEGKQRRIEIFDAASGQRTALCEGYWDDVWAYTFSPDSSRLASVSEDKTARVWDAATGELLTTCRGHTSKVVSAAFSPDGARLVTASADGTVRQWDARTGREVEPPYDRHANEVYTAVYSPDGQWVASAGFDRTIRVWRATGRQDVAVLHGHTGPVFQVAFAPDGRRLASLSWRSAITAVGDKTARVWEVDPGATLPVLRGHTSYVYPVAFSPDGRWLASGSWDKTVRLWDAATGEPCATLLHPNYVLDLAFGPDGTWLITGCHGDDRLRIWDTATGRVRQTIPLLGKFCTLAVSPDGTRVAATSRAAEHDKWRVIVYEIASAQPLFSTDGAALAYSPDGRWLAVRAADEKTVLLLDARTHEMVARFLGHEKTVDKAAFSPDSRVLASCSRDHTVRLWQIDSGECRVLSGHTDEVFAVAFHPDAPRLATVGRDGAVWLWDLESRTEMVRLPGHRSYVWSLAFSPDGRTLASGSGDGTVRLWDTEPLKTRYDARRAAAALRPEAERLVARLWREMKDPAAVVAALRADRELSEALRQAAVRSVLRRVQTVDWLLSGGFLP